ncbi:WhiB family transcription factor [Gordonia Phage Sephiroth]|uniref:WhiB family transcription factor n=1 Tax=Gordonia Phage Sephiroth TaxID=2767553 RepID=A0A7G9UZF3_9CAUD|nr:WhiB family transcription factor [Gordonia Phage Sephiroth]QNN99408.1 WhiB family transcription factor [Gordonia Phage Sephiroth]
MTYFRPRPELDWQLGAKCRDDDPKKWEVENLNPLLDRRIAAESLCNGCFVREECHADALQTFDDSTYLGFEYEFDSDYTTAGVVRAGRIF